MVIIPVYIKILMDGTVGAVTLPMAKWQMRMKWRMEVNLIGLILHIKRPLMSTAILVFMLLSITMALYGGHAMIMLLKSEMP